MISILTIITLCSIGLARALMTFNLPDYKPLNCQSCLSFWISVIAYLAFDPYMLMLSFITYLVSDLILLYEYK
jgi:hypothetical protein